VLDWAVLALYFIFIGYLSWDKDWKNQDEEQFLLLGRKMTLPAFVGTLFSTWYGGILGVGEYSYQFGISQWLLFGVPFYVFSALFALFLADKIRGNPARSIPEAIANVYGEKAGQFSAFPIFILISPAPYILMFGLLAQYLMGGSGHILIYAAFIALFTVIYTSFSGFSAVVRTDMLQAVLMMGGFVMLVIFAFMEFGSFSTLWSAVPETYTDFTGGRDLQYILVWFFIALWTFVDPSFHQRVAAAETPEVAKRGIYTSIVLWIGFDFLTAFSGMYAWAILGPGLENPAMSYPVLADQILPMGLKGLFFVALLAAIMSTLDSYLFISGQTLGRDLLAKVLPQQPRNRLTRISILIASALGLLLIIVYPSVIDLWYVIGSVMIPGLLIPVLGIYLKQFRLKRKWVLPLMALSIGASLFWLILGTLTQKMAYSYTFLGIEPFYPGLFVSIICWLAGRDKSTTSAEMKLKEEAAASE